MAIFNSKLLVYQRVPLEQPIIKVTSLDPLGLRNASHQLADGGVWDLKMPPFPEGIVRSSVQFP